MPTVPAAGYPTGPEAPPAVPLTVPVDDYLRVNATPEAFGAQVGQSMSALGRVLTTSAGELAQVANERQQLHNQVVTDNLINNWSDAAEKQMSGDPNAPPGSPAAIGFMGLRGGDAVNAYPALSDALRASREQYRGSLENQMQQLEFDKQTRHQLQFIMSRAGSHFDQQYDTFQTETNKAGAVLATQKMGQSIDDQAAFDAAVADRMRYEYRQLQAQGLAGDDNAVNAMLGRVRSDAVKTRIETYLGRNNTAAAADVLNRESGPGGALTPADAARYRTVLSDANVSTSVDRAMGRGGGGGPIPSAPLAPAEYKPLVDKASSQYNVPPELLTRLLSAENDFKPTGRSSAGAEGIAQFMPETAKTYGVDVNDPESSILGAAHYLADLKAQTGSWHAALKGYLGGEPMNDPSYTKKGVWQFADQLDKGGAPPPLVPPGGPVGQPLPGTRSPGVAPPAAPGAIEVRGDSLGVGLKGRLGGAGTAVGGASPTAIFADIKTEPESHWQGKTVVLPSGSNGNQMPVVEDTIKYLQDHGANVIAVGYGPKFPEKNAQLAEIAGRLKVPVIAAEDVSPSEGVHPSPQGYQSMADKIRAAAAGIGAPVGSGQAALANGKPDYATAIARVNADPSLNPDERKRALGMIGEQMRIEHEAQAYPDEAAQRELKRTQTANEADLFAQAVQGKPLDPGALADMLRTQKITPAGYNAIIAEAGRTDRGTDDIPSVMDLTRRAGAGEDVTNDVYAARQAGKLRGSTAIELIKTTETRQREVTNELERRDFATLRTIAGMDAADHPMVDFGKEANASQVALWGQAQTEWNRRVIVGKEAPDAVLADMTPRYGKPLDDPRDLPRPRMGAIEKQADIPAIVQATKDAHDKGILTDLQVQQESELLVKYDDLFNARARRDAAIKSVPPPSGDRRVRSPQ